LPLAALLLPVLTALAADSAAGAVDVVDVGGGFAAGVGDAGGWFAAGVGGTGGGLPLGSAAPGVALLPVSAAPVANNRNNIRLQTVNLKKKNLCPVCLSIDLSVFLSAHWLLPWLSVCLCVCPHGIQLLCLPVCPPTIIFTKSK
jgi:hypothetical protein